MGEADFSGLQTRVSLLPGASSKQKPEHRHLRSPARDSLPPFLPLPTCGSHAPGLHACTLSHPLRLFPMHFVVKPSPRQPDLGSGLSGRDVCSVRGSGPAVWPLARDSKWREVSHSVLLQPTHRDFRRAGGGTSIFQVGYCFLPLSGIPLEPPVWGQQSGVNQPLISTLL